MTTPLKWIVGVFVTGALLNCTQPKYPAGIEKALSNADDFGQRPSLEAILEHYTAPRDSLKRQAAHFLVEHFPYRQILNIDTTLVIENIELAFAAWKKPWAKHLNFDEFKELILPFNLEKDSTGVFWRKRFAQEYSFVEDSLKWYKGYDVTIAACCILNNALKKKYSIGGEIGTTKNPSTFSQWQKTPKGDCFGVSELVNQIMHSVGIPTAVELTPLWANMTDKHYWATVYASNRRFYSFAPVERNPGSTKIELVYVNFIRKRSKVFRLGYAQNPQSLAALTIDAPGIFSNPHLFDVSKGNIPTQTAQVSLPDSVDSEFVYLSVFSRKALQAIAWAKPKEGKAVFEDVRSDVVYVPTVYQHDQYMAVGEAFILQKDGSQQPLLAGSTHQTIVCSKKYPVDSTNNIKVGDEYELSYWKKGRWHKIGSKVATEKKVSFEKVPQDALLILSDLTRGRKERVFLYQQNKQVFW